MRWTCLLGFHDWSKPAQGEMSQRTRDILTAAASRLPAGAVIRDSVTPWFQTCKQCGKREEC